MKLRITKHAMERGKERLGLNKKAFRRIAQQALERGIMHSEVRGRLRRYMDKLFLEHDGGANNMRIYKQYMYFFKRGLLITVVEVPNRYKKYINELNEKLCKA